jgi:CRISPR type I-E-associated protein CasB/Cse2
MSLLTKEQAYEFARFLYGLAGAEGRATVAELRRAAADPEHDFRDLRLLGSRLADDSRVFDAQRLTAGLFALYAARFWQPNGSLKLPPFAVDNRRTFGASLRNLRGQLKAGADSLDIRFGALLNAPREDLAVPLRGLLARLATAERAVPVDFARLLQDLVYWDSNSRSVRRDWARDYWQPATIDSVNSLDAAPASSNQLPA